MNSTEISARFEELQVRSKETAYKLQAAIPVSNLSSESQQAFLLAFSDLKLLEHLLETAQSTVNAIALQDAPEVENDDDNDSFSSGLSNLLSQIVAAVVEQFGVSEDLILPALMKDVARQLELTESILQRCEESVALLKE